MRTVQTVALLGLFFLSVSGCGYRLIKASDLAKIQASPAAASALPTSNAEPLRHVKASEVEVELGGGEDKGKIEVGEAGEDYADIPRYPGSREILVHGTAAGDGTSPREADALTYQTRASLSAVAAFYRRVLPAHGWRLVPNSTQTGEDLGTASYWKGDESLDVEFSRLLHSMLRSPGGGDLVEVTEINIALAARNQRD